MALTELRMYETFSSGRTRPPVALIESEVMASSELSCAYGYVLSVV